MKKLMILLFACSACLAATTSCYAQASFFDPTFGTGGKVIGPFEGKADGSFEAIVLQPDGKIVVCGDMNSKATIARFRENGTPDTSFGVNGFYFYSGAFSSLYDLALQPDGKILSAGRIELTNSEYLTIRLNPDGTPDVTFGGSGIVTTDVLPFTNDNGKSIAIQSDGKILVAGNASLKIGLVRMNADGIIDSSFGTNGIVANEYGDICCVEIAGDGGIVVGGYSNATGLGLSFNILRYLSAGILDTSFNHTGTVNTIVGDTWNYGRALKLQPDGKILISGSGTFGTEGSNFVVVRYNSNGTLDGAFGSGGSTNIDFYGGGDEAWDLCLATDGKILLTGIVTKDNEDFGIARLNSSGTLDNSFGIGGRVSTSLQDKDDKSFAIALQPDGKIILAGTSVILHPYRAPVVARYLQHASAVTDMRRISSNVSLCPNPASSELRFSECSVTHVTTVGVTDATGKTMNIKYQRGAKTIDISGLTDGLYFFKLKYEDGSENIEKVLVRK